MAQLRINGTSVLTMASNRAMRDLYLAHRAEGYALYLEEKPNADRDSQAHLRARRRLSLRHPREYRLRYEQWREDLGWTPAPDGRSRARPRLEGEV